MLVPLLPRRRRRALAAAIAVLALTAHPAGALAQVDADAAAPLDAAQEAFRRGNEHAKAKRWPEALAAYEEAYALRPAWDIAGNLGIAALELGRPRKAATHLDEALRAFPGSGKPDQRKLLSDAFDRAVAAVGRLTIRTSVAGSAIAIDGVSVGTSPLVRSVFVDPGHHVIEARADGSSGKQEIEVAAGAERDVLVTLATSSSAAPHVVTPPPEDHDERPVWPAIALGGVAVVGLGAGIGLAVAAGGASSDAEARVSDAAAAGTPCRGGETTGFCAEAADLLAESDALTAGSVVGFVIGGAAAIGAVTYLVWPSNAADAPRARVAPLLGPDLWGARGGISF